MSNKRVSELVPLTWADIAVNDLFLISDVSVIQSKKISVEDLLNYVNIDGNIISASHAIHADTASYLDTTDLFVSGAFNCVSSSYAKTASWAYWAFTSSYITASNIDGIVPTSSYSKTASYLLFTPFIDNGTAFHAISASFVTTAASASHLNYSGNPDGTGTPNGTASFAITASFAFRTPTASFLYYDGVNPNGTASYAVNSNMAVYSSTASFLYYDLTNPNGTASYAINSNDSVNSKTASYLLYQGWDNGTSSFAISSSNSFTSSYSISSSFTDTSSYSFSSSYAFSASIAISSSYSVSSSMADSSSYTLSASYAVTASFAPLGLNEYNIFGPFTASYEDTGAVNVFIPWKYLVIGENNIGVQDTIIQALGDIKVPGTTVAASGYVSLKVTNTDSSPWVATLDTSYPEYIMPTSGAGTYVREGFSLSGKLQLSGSLYQLSVESGNGVTIGDVRKVQFYVYTKADDAVISTT